MDFTFQSDSWPGSPLHVLSYLPLFPPSLTLTFPSLLKNNLSLFMLKSDTQTLKVQPVEGGFPFKD